MLRLVWSMVLVIACSVSPDDGQFLCSDGRCPAGQTCIDGVCRDGDASERDAGERDAGVDDASLDGSLLDAGERDGGDDARVVDEVCTSTNQPQIDEDGDGAIDEGCAWSFGNAHPVLDVPVGPDLHWSPILGGDGTRLYFGYSGDPSGVYMARRTSVDARFELASEPIRLRSSPSADPIFVVAIDTAETTLVAQAGGTLFRAERPTAGDAFGTWIEIGPGTHPALRGDGLELVFVLGAQVFRATRSSVGRDFGAPTVALEGDETKQFPRMTPDGRTLFFQGSGGQTHIASRTSVDLPFGDVVVATELPVGSSFSVFPATREVFFVAVSEDGPATQSIWRAEVCRALPCPPRHTDCPVGFEAIGYGCYETSPGGFTTIAAARDHCAAREATLASVASLGERTRLGDLGFLSSTVSMWTGGFTESLAPGMVDYRWPTDEAFVEYADAWAVRPVGDDLLSRCIGATTSGWVARSCTGGESARALCQVVRWPTWPHP